MPSPIPGTGIVAVSDSPRSFRLFYQSRGGRIVESRHVGGMWFSNVLSLSPVGGSPLASITYGAGRETRVYCLDTDNIVQEYCYTQNKGWYNGGIGTFGAKATPAAGLAAIVFDAKTPHSGGVVSIHVFFQAAETGQILELIYDGSEGSWVRGQMHIEEPIDATGLAAVAYHTQSQRQIRVYYQNRDLSLREWCYTDGDWYPGGFNPGKATARTPLAALVSGDIELEVYYRDVEGRLVSVKNTGSWSGAGVIQGVGPGSNSAVLQWEKGTRRELYYQESSGPIVRLRSEDGGKSWVPDGVEAGKQVEPELESGAIVV